MFTGEITELKPNELWIPEKSDHFENSRWIEEEGLKEKQKMGILILLVSKQENRSLLNIETYEFLLKIHDFINNFTSKDGLTYKNECMNSPVGFARTDATQRRAIIKEFPYPSICFVIEYFLSQIEPSCANLTPLLALTPLNDIGNITDSLDTFMGNETLFLEHFNSLERAANESGVSKAPRFKSIGGIIRNPEGNIEGAKALSLAYLLKKEGVVDQNLVSNEQMTFKRELKDELVSKFVSTLDTEVMDMLVTGGVKQEVYNLLKDDFVLMLLGCFLVVLHLITSFSQFNTVEQRVGLAICGLLSCALSVTSMNGFCQLIGLPFNVLVNLVMIMLVGIGVDDMFVVIQTVKATKAKQTQR